MQLHIKAYQPSNIVQTFTIYNTSGMCPLHCRMMYDYGY